ncbi:hypothetical protein FSC37_19530 [Piscinibacter aquaticus]|uniref:Lipoprotein n=1 Tax=Piscinibacter aquaticus TaxID=392597 RepID=A0A5C6U4W8_9BURK|nr:hypothetical protein FSC37_19530 [Piscinibacter aquaticus]
MRTTVVLSAWACVLVLVSAGCASEVRREAVELAPVAAEQGRRYVSTSDAEAVPESRYARRIARGTEFLAIGRIAQGLVLKPTTTVLTVEGAHMHEAYAVCRDGQIVGFYLPVERAFTPLVKPAPMPLQEKTSP